MVKYYNGKSETHLLKAKEKYEASKVTCPCGKLYSTLNKAHVKCNQHRDWEWHEAVKRGERPNWELSKRGTLQRNVRMDSEESN